MDVIIDGLIYQGQQHGGILRLYSEILPRMCEMDKSLNITLLLSGQIRKSLPSHENIKNLQIPAIEKFLRPSIVWNSLLPQIRSLFQMLWINVLNSGIWHSTYYTLPLNWKGLKVVTIFDMIHEHFPDFFGKDGREFCKQKYRCINAADRIIAISQATSEDLQNFYGINKNKIYVTHLACSDIFLQQDSFKSDYAYKAIKPFLLYVGMRTHYKNTILLVKAYSKWHHNKEIDLIVVGRPWTEKQITELVTLGIKDKVHILGYGDDNTLAQLYRKAVAFVFPSLYEGFGIPLLEAMACGCPVIASRIRSTLEVAGDCPIYFEPTNLEEMLNSFNIALYEGRNSARVRDGLEHVKRYSWDRTASETLKVYESLL